MNNNYIGVDLDLFRQPTIQRLELKHGKGSVAVYLQICLKLAEQNGFMLVEDVPILSREFFVKEEVITQVLNFPDLFIFKNNSFSCGWVTAKVSASQQKSDKARQSVLKRWADNEGNTNVIPTYNEGNTIKEIKEKKINKIKKENKGIDLKQILDLVDQNTQIDDKVKPTLVEFFKHRDAKKVNTTAYAIDLILKKLAPYSISIQTQMLENAITGGWTNIYTINNLQTVQPVVDNEPTAKELFDSKQNKQS